MPHSPFRVVAGRRLGPGRRGVRVLAIPATVVLIGLSIFVSAPSAFAVGCHGSGCNGKSPATMGCSADAVSVNHVVFDDRASGGTFARQVVTLRYSRACNASWSRVTASAGGTAHVTSSTAYMGGFKTSTKRTLAGPGSVYSNMRAGSSIESCATTRFNSTIIETHCATAG